ncbi:hypothetical protein L227DRAFT_76192 [Lentinus tigrinus ALCF2SS1-6]|uniref:Uncharacterized protein n=1 Tax=Lentinus tigrinus ALCF2SS1-6 TaxID=1328759 RepID=A0A5C2SCW5_9APHY|nr:hypothetical protein L227DRAFT_76192 [Lentinus tigrinus ALCF2SS1-6]
MLRTLSPLRTAHFAVRRNSFAVDTSLSRSPRCSVHSFRWLRRLLALVCCTFYSCNECHHGSHSASCLHIYSQDDTSFSGTSRSYSDGH